MKRQNGFTLIELVMVIVILGILAAVAIPKFVDLGDDAKKAALAGVVGGINSASAVNYAARSATLNSTPRKGVATTGLTCATAAAAILQGGVPVSYSLSTSQVLVDGDNTCTVTATGYTPTQDAVIIGVQ